MVTVEVPVNATAVVAVPVAVEYWPI